MDSLGLVAVVSVLATLATLGALGGTALLVGAYVSQRSRLQGAELSLATAQDELKSIKRARRNKLYAGSMEEYGFAARQSIIRLRALRAEIESEFSVMEKMLDLSKE